MQGWRDPRRWAAQCRYTLNNLGILYGATGRLAEAKAAFAETLSIYRELALDNPNVYAGLAASISNRLNTLHEEPESPATSQIWPVYKLYQRNSKKFLLRNS
jgi:Tetratricopeptide repeat